MKDVRTCRGLLGVALVFTLIFAWTPHPPALIPNDKAQHALAFAVLTILAIYAYPSVRLWKAAALLSLFGAGIELVQGLSFIHRDCDIYDWYADIEAVAATISVILLLRWARHAVRAPPGYAGSPDK